MNFSTDIQTSSAHRIASQAQNNEWYCLPKIYSKIRNVTQLTMYTNIFRRDELSLCRMYAINLSINYDF